MGGTALGLGHFFEISAESWLTLQTIYDLRMAEQNLLPRNQRLAA